MMETRTFDIAGQQVTATGYRDEEGDDTLRLAFWTEDGSFYEEAFEIENEALLNGLLRDMSSDTAAAWLDAMKEKMGLNPVTPAAD